MQSLGWRTLWMILGLALAGVAAVRADNESITFEPPFPTTLDVVVAVVHQANTCRVWFYTATTDPLTVLSREGLSPCPPNIGDDLAAQRVVLGRLAQGVHTVRALQQSTQTLLATADVTVRDPGYWPDLQVDVDPRLPTSADVVSLRLRGFVPCVSGFQGATVIGDVVDLVVSNLNFDPCPPFPLDESHAVGRLPPGDYQVELAGGAVGAFHVAPVATYLSLSFGSAEWDLRSFRSTLDRSPTPDATPDLAPAVALGDQAGYFWFFDPGNVEVSLKLLDGRPINGHFWVFASSLTDRPFTLTVVDQGHCLIFDAPLCPIRTYTGRAGEIHNVIDLEAFPD